VFAEELMRVVGHLCRDQLELREDNADLLIGTTGAPHEQKFLQRSILVLCGPGAPRRGLAQFFRTSRLAPGFEF
jgi:hypothetical protein